MTPAKIVHARAWQVASDKFLSLVVEEYSVASPLSRIDSFGTAYCAPDTGYCMWEGH